MLKLNENQNYWTGAKAIEGKNEEQKAGICRLKSGRSDIKEELRSQSMSCSDKILLWNALGITSPILGNLIEPIYLSSITLEIDKN